MMGLYYPIKYLFLLWLFLPQFKGALTIYERIVRPILKKYELIIDEHLATVSEKVMGAVKVVKDKREWNLYMIDLILIKVC